jgi:hypothetical protein
MRYRMMLPLWIALLVCGCGTLYQPSSVATHQFRGSGEVIAAGYFGPSGWNGQAAWSPLAHVALHGGAAWVNPSSSEYTSPTSLPPYFGQQIVGQNLLAEGAAGWYTATGSLGSLAIYAGYGAGHVVIYHYANRFPADTAWERAEGDYHRYTVQVNIGRVIVEKSEGATSRKPEEANIGAVVKISCINYDRLDGSLQRLNPPGGIVLEPMVYIQTGTRYLQYGMQAGFATPLRRWNGLSVYPLQISVGIRANLDRLF